MILKIIIIVFVFLMSYEAKGEYSLEGIIDTSKSLSSLNKASPVTAEALVITSGKGKIVIHFNGKVEIIDTNLDEASKEFWNKISKAFPSFKEKIIDEYRNTKGINGVIVSEP